MVGFYRCSKPELLNYKISFKDFVCFFFNHVKFYNSQFSIDKTYFTKLQKKINSFKEENSIRKGVGLTFITTFGIKQLN